MPRTKTKITAATCTTDICTAATKTVSTAAKRCPARKQPDNEQPLPEQPAIEDTFIRETRVNYLPSEQAMFKIVCAADVANFVRSILTDNSREHFVAMYLDSLHQVTAYSIISIGTANMAPVAPREVFQRAILSGAISIVVSHNHPSGSPYPSDDNRAVTKRLHESGDLLGIKLLDHVIVANGSHYSFRDEGAL